MFLGTVSKLSSVSEVPRLEQDVQAGLPGLPWCGKQCLVAGKAGLGLASGCAPEIVGMINTPVPHFHLQAQPDQVESGLAEATPSPERQCTS